MNRRGSFARRDESGVGIVEVAIAFTVMLLVLVPVAYLLMNVLTQTGNARQKVTALGIAEQWIETMNDYGPPLNAQGLPSPPIGQSVPTTPTAPLPSPYNLNPVSTVGSVTYTASATFNWNTVNGDRNLCDTATVPTVLDLQVTVTWSNGNVAITDTTVINWPPASLPADGFIGVQINGNPPWQVNAAGQEIAGPPVDAAAKAWDGSTGRVQSVPITVYPVAAPGAITQTVNPDGSNGCAFIEEPPGTYSIQVGPDTSSFTNAFVQPDGTTQAVTPPATPVTVNINQVTQAGPYLYDEGAYVNVQYPNTTATEDGVVCPNVGLLQCLITGQSPIGTANGTSGTTATASVYSGTTLSPAALPSSLGMSRIESMACAGTNACIAAGYGSGGAAAVFDVPSATPGNWMSATPPAGINVLSQVQCPSATLCFAIGSSGPFTAPVAVLLTGVVGTSPASVTWTSNTLPNGPVSHAQPSSLTQITCSTTPANGCYAVGADTSGAVVLSFAQSATTPAFVSDPLPNGPVSHAQPSSLTRITCSAPNACFAIGADSSGAIVLAGAQSPTAPAFVSPTLPNGPVSGLAPSSLTQINCSAPNACFAIGQDTKGAVVLSFTQSATAPVFVSDPLPTNPVSAQKPSSLTQIACPATTAACMAIGEDSSGAVVLSGAQSATTPSFVDDTFPVGDTVNSLSQLTCFPGTANTCVATGAGASAAAIVTGAIQSGTQTLGGGVFPNAATSPVFISGVACEGSGPICEAAGATTSSAVVLSDVNLSPTSSITDWASTAIPNVFNGANNIAGLHAIALPIGVSNSLIPGNQFYVACPACATSAAGTSSIGPLFPFVAGDSVGAAACVGDLGNNASALASLQPGASVTGAPAVTVPLGLLPIQVLNANGTPAAKASVSVSVTTSGCSGTYPLTPSGQDGSTRADVIYETYTVTATAFGGSPSATATVLVTPTQSILNPGATQTAFPLPTPVQVKL